jgi:dipeptidyl aminopeptidase/acylaminoacyl peptidase
VARIHATALLAALALSGSALAAPPVELTPPAGAHAGERPRGLVMVLHGGNWLGGNGVGIVIVRPWAQWFNRQGWSALNADYDSGGQALGQIAALYDRWRRRLGPRVPICAAGQSAGGHLALMLAAIRRSLDCVIAEAAPTDFPLLAASSRSGAVAAAQVAQTMLGDPVAWSPVHWAKRIRAPVALSYATDDPLVPVSQGRVLARRLHGETVSVLRPGPIPWVHTHVSSGSLTAAARAERALLRGTGGRA